MSDLSARAQGARLALFDGDPKIAAQTFASISGSERTPAVRRLQWLAEDALHSAISSDETLSTLIRLVEVLDNDERTAQQLPTIVSKLETLSETWSSAGRIRWLAIEARLLAARHLLVSAADGSLSEESQAQIAETLDRVSADADLPSEIAQLASAVRDSATQVQRIDDALEADIARARVAYAQGEAGRNEAADILADLERRAPGYRPLVELRQLWQRQELEACLASEEGRLNNAAAAVEPIFTQLWIPAQPITAMSAQAQLYVAQEQKQTQLDRARQLLDLLPATAESEDNQQRLRNLLDRRSQLQLQLAICAQDDPWFDQILQRDQVLRGEPAPFRNTFVSWRRAFSEKVRAEEAVSRADWDEAIAAADRVDSHLTHLGARVKPQFRAAVEQARRSFEEILPTIRQLASDIAARSGPLETLFSQLSRIQQSIDADKPLILAALPAFSANCVEPYRTLWQAEVESVLRAGPDAAAEGRLEQLAAIAPADALRPSAASLRVQAAVIRARAKLSAGQLGAAAAALSDVEDDFAQLDRAEASESGFENTQSELDRRTRMAQTRLSHAQAAYQQQPPDYELTIEQADKALTFDPELAEARALRDRAAASLARISPPKPEDSSDPKNPPAQEGPDKNPAAARRGILIGAGLLLLLLLCGGGLAIRSALGGEAITPTALAEVTKTADALAAATLVASNPTSATEPTAADTAEPTKSNTPVALPTPEPTFTPVPPTATAEPPTAIPTPAPQLRFNKLNDNDEPTCFTVQVLGAATGGWTFSVDGIPGINAVFDNSGNARACGLGYQQEFTFTVFNARGRSIPGGRGVEARGGAIMQATYK